MIQFPLDWLEQLIISINEFFGIVAHLGSSSLAVTSSEFGLL